MAFPTTSVLDDFNRANEGPPPSSSWTCYSAGNGLKVSSNTCITSADASDYPCRWNTSYGPDCEVYFTATTVAASKHMTLYVRATDTLATLDGYIVNALTGSGTSIYRYDDGTPTQLGASLGNPGWGNGDKFGLEIIGTSNNITAYRKPAAGAWASLGTRDDSTYQNAGYIAARLYNTALVMDDFGGGTIGGGATASPTGVLYGPLMGPLGGPI